jgi:O-antigen/teichoic acid export membrane protein
VLQDDYTVVASRLSPSDFGLVAFAGPPFANMGISSAVVQKPEFGNRDVRVGFAGSIAAELLVSTVVILKAPAIDVLFAQHEVVPVLRMLTLSFAIMSFGSVALEMLQRDMKFRQLAIIDVLSYALAYPWIRLWLVWRVPAFGALSRRP